MTDPERELRIDNLLSAFGALLQRERLRVQRDEQLAADLLAIRDTLAISLTYSHAEACRRMGNFGPSWGYLHPEMLPAPMKRAGKVVRRVLLPMSSVGIIGGVLLNFGWNVAIFSIPLVLSFKGSPFTPVDIYFSVRYGIRWSYAATLSVVLFVVTFGLSYLYTVLALPKGAQDRGSESDAS